MDLIFLQAFLDFVRSMYTDIEQSVQVNFSAPMPMPNPLISPSSSQVHTPTDYIPIHASSMAYI